MDGTALVKQGRHALGVAWQCRGQLGRRANCQALAPLTLARGEVPIRVGLRVERLCRSTLPDAWLKDADRRLAAGVPGDVTGRPKWRIALDGTGRLRNQDVRFGCVPGDAECGKVALFRHALDDGPEAAGAQHLPGEG